MLKEGGLRRESRGTPFALNFCFFRLVEAGDVKALVVRLLALEDIWRDDGDGGDAALRLDQGAWRGRTRGGIQGSDRGRGKTTVNGW